MSELIHGTWDFKWPRGKRIRVAFQALSADDAAVMPELPALIARYIDIANRWLVRDPNIGFDFPEPALVAPAPAPRPEGLPDARSARGDAPLQYDVLVSFASTPCKVYDAVPEFETEITGQLSVLGSYARRINHGTPTTMVGPNREFVPEGKRLGDYFAEPVFEEVVVHEVGHMLGIPHQHQNPLYDPRPPLKDDAAVRAVLEGIRTKYWTKFDGAIVSELGDPWPHLPARDGKIPHSDWRAIENLGTKRLENLSVTAHPVWTDVTTLQGAEALGPIHTQPTAWDLDLLSEMYPQR